MAITRTVHGRTLASEPSLLPFGSVCFINNIPSEFLLHIFELGSTAGHNEHHKSSKDDDSADDDSEDSEGHENEDETDRVHWPLDEEEEMDKEDETEQEDSEDEDEEAVLEITLPFPIIISHVCRHWRKLALSRPSLWTNIKVFTVEGDLCQLQSAMLQRSRTLPIDVMVDGRSFDIPLFLDDDPFPLLVSHIHRWRTMAVVVREYTTMHSFLDALLDPSLPSASQLRSLDLRYTGTLEFDYTFKPGMPTHVTLPAGSASFLTTLVLHGISVDWNAPWVRSATNLRDLQLRNHSEDLRPSWTQFYNILRGASSLEKLTLDRSGPSGNPAEWLLQPLPESPADPNTPLHLSCLTFLSLHGVSIQPFLLGLLCKIRLPVLENLYLNLFQDDYTDFVYKLAGPTMSPSCQGQPRSLLSQLTTLTIVKLTCRNNCLETLLGELQNLRTLEILSFPCFLDALRAPCRLPGCSGVWLPRLETLYIPWACGRILCRLVKWRRNKGAPLSSLHLTKWNSTLPKELKWLRKNLKKVEVPN